MGSIIFRFEGSVFWSVVGCRGSPRSPIAESSKIVPLDVLMQTLSSVLTSNYIDVD